MIIGGAEIFRLSMDVADRLYITEIDNVLKAIHFSQHIVLNGSFTEKTEVMTSKTGTPFSYLIYDKKQ